MVSDKQVRIAIYNTLNVASVTGNLADGSASICHGVALSSAKYPLIIFNKQSGIADMRGFGTTAGTATNPEAQRGTPSENQLWLVKAIAKGGSSSVAEDTMEDVAAVLDFATLTISGATEMYCARESSVDYIEQASGDIYRHVGQIYRLIYA